MESEKFPLLSKDAENTGVPSKAEASLIQTSVLVSFVDIAIIEVSVRKWCGWLQCLLDIQPNQESRILA